jgi:phage-related protein
MKKLLTNKYAIIAGSVGAFVVSATSVFADVPTASSTLSTIMGVIISTTVDLATTIFTTYWPYVLIFGIIAGLVGVFARFLHIGGKK